MSADKCIMPLVNSSKKIVHSHFSCFRSLLRKSKTIFIKIIVSRSQKEINILIYLVSYYLKCFLLHRNVEYKCYMLYFHIKTWILSPPTMTTWHIHCTNVQMFLICV